MDPSASGVIREAPDVSDQRSALVQKILKRVRDGKQKHEKAFKRMRRDLKFVRYQWPEQQPEDDRAIVNVIQRHVAQRTSSLYAKNPTFTASRKKRLDFSLWDGRAESMQLALSAMQMAGQMPVPPEIAALMQDIEQGQTRRQMLDGVGKTLETVMHWSLEEQNPPFKPRAKKLVRRTISCGVGYLKLGYQRQLAKRPDVEAKLSDITDRLANVERLQADLQDDKLDSYSAEAEELRLAQQALMAEPEKVVREGLIFDFPHSHRIIPDPATKELVGWVGSGWLAEEFPMTPEEAQEVYGVDLKARGYAGYQVQDYGVLKRSAANQQKQLACVWEVYDRKDGLVYTVCDGYPDFLVEPAAPPVSVEQFFPIYPLLFNDVENEDDLFPPSDVEFLRPIQKEINRKREALRQHRIASRPFYLGQRGKFEEDDMKDLANVNAHDVLFTNAMDANEKLDNVIQRFPSAPVDPNLYETASDISDVQLVVGSQEANLGGVSSKSTATQSSIAETSRMSSASSNIDDLDEFLSLIARDAGAILLANLTEETAKRLAGPGAIWPVLSRQQIAEEVFLDIQAGSSGRPNKDQELANLERVTPFLLQIPGVSPEWLARQIISTLDSRIDLEEAVLNGLPAILTLNRQQQVSTGDPATDPGAQAGQGANNAPQGDATPGGPQAAFPAASPAQPNVAAPSM